jgi:hypothetical protein
MEITAMLNRKSTNTYAIWQYLQLSTKHGTRKPLTIVPVHIQPIGSVADGHLPSTKFCRFNPPEEAR